MYWAPSTTTCEDNDSAFTVAVQNASALKHLTQCTLVPEGNRQTVCASVTGVQQACCYCASSTNTETSDNSDNSNVSDASGGDSSLSFFWFYMFPFFKPWMYVVINECMVHILSYFLILSKYLLLIQKYHSDSW